MRICSALAIALVVSSTLALTAPLAPTYAAAAVCQGQPATIEGSTGTITGTEGNDVIVSTGPGTEVKALGGDDIICVVGGTVETGPGDDSVVSTAPVGIHTTVFLFGGNDRYAGGDGGDTVTADEVTSMHVTMGSSFGVVELYPTSTVGTGTVDFGTTPGHLFAFGLETSRVDLAGQTASVDGLLTITTTHMRSATATGCRVRMKGDDANNVLDAYGRDVVVSGGDGRDTLARVGNRFDLDLPPCGRYKSVFRGQGGPDRLSGRIGDDVLLGGRGRDVAQGRGGLDTCRAEVERGCER
jgi:Ca2+-binding RTX toxin-like protein